MLAIGFLGCGLIARHHAKKLQRSGADIDIATVFDLDPARAAAFSESFGARVADDAQAVIDQSDAVYVCTWTSSHRELVERVAGANKAVFCEKPLATNLADARAMADAVASAGVVNQVGLILRHSPSFRWLRGQVNDADHGKIMNIVFRDDQYLPTQGMYRSTWRGDPALAGSGTLLEHSIHDLDLLEWLMGPIQRVSCMSNEVHGLTGIEDSVTVTLQAASGAQASLVSVWHDVLSRPSQRRVEVLCERAVLTLEGDWSGPVRCQTSRRETVLEGLQLATGEHSENPDADFVTAVLDGSPAVPGFALALQAHAAADAAYRSAAQGGTPMPVERFTV